MSERDSISAQSEKPAYHRSKHYERVLAERVRSGEWWVTPTGEIWAHKTTRSREPKRIDMLASNGYRKLSVAIDGKRVDCWAHRLVWQVFFGDIPGDMTVNHKNRERADNRPENLELCTMAENVLHAYYGPNPAAHNASKLTAEKVREIRESSSTMKALGRRYGVAPQTIKAILRRKTWKHVS